MISNLDYLYQLEEKSPPPPTTDIAHYDVLNHQAHTLTK